MSRGMIKVNDSARKTDKNLPIPNFNAKSGNLKIVGIENVDRENTVIWYSILFARNDLNLGMIYFGRLLLLGSKTVKLDYVRVSSSIVN